MTRRWTAGVVAVALGTLPAQDQGAAANELQRLSRELLEAGARGTRLVELRVRHELGLKVEASTHWELTEAERAPPPEHWQQRLDAEQLELQRLSAQEDSLRRMLDQRRTRSDDVVLASVPIAERPIAERPIAERPIAERSVAELPVAKLPAAELPPRAVTSRAPPPRGDVPRVPAATDPGTASRPSGPASRATAKADAGAGAEQPALILGSTDHGRVGRALFLARRFEEARKELLLIPADQARLVDLFHLARCHEQLGAFEEARQVYLAVETRDTKPNDPLGGPWAQAARTARRTMGWLQDRGAWKPALTIDAKPAPESTRKRQP